LKLLRVLTADFHGREMPDLKYLRQLENLEEIHMSNYFLSTLDMTPYFDCQPFRPLKQLKNFSVALSPTCCMFPVENSISHFQLFALEQMVVTLKTEYDV